MNFIRHIGVLLLALMSMAAWAQTVSGTETDENNQPLPGATVIVQGTNNGTSTDFDGKYQINATQGQTLAFSYVGYATQNVTVSTATHAYPNKLFAYPIPVAEINANSNIVQNEGY